MKKLTFAAAVLALLVVGCKPKEETVITGPDGSKVTATNDGAKVSVTDDKGNTVTSEKSGDGTKITDSKGNSVALGTTVSEAALGLPFYTGSEEKSNSSAIVDEPTGKTVMSVRSSKDDPDKVSAFYKDKIKSATSSNTNAGDTKMATMQGKLDNGAEVTLMAMRKTGEDTTISITVKTPKK